MLTQDQIETMRAIADKTSEGPGYERVRLLPVWAWISAWNGKAWEPVLTEAGREVLAQAEQVEALKKFADQLVDARDAVAKEADTATVRADGLQARLKLLDGPTDPTAPQDLADALAYADEIDSDPTPPTSAVHRWLVALTRALWATQVTPDPEPAPDLGDPMIPAFSWRPQMLTTDGLTILAVSDGLPSEWWYQSGGKTCIARRQRDDADHRAAWADAQPDLANGATLGALLDAICERLGMPDAHLVRFPTNVPDGRGGSEPALWWALADGLGKPICVETGGRHYWAGATKGEALMSAWGEIP